MGPALPQSDDPMEGDGPSLSECKDTSIINNGGVLYAAKTREERLQGRKVIVILDAACLELIYKNRTYELLNGIDHSRQLKMANRSWEDCRPDITHQCLLALLDSPLNKAGKLLVYIQTADKQLIEVSPHLQVPRSWNQFSAFMVTFLQRHKIKAVEKNIVLMRLIKNDLDKMLPPGSRKIGRSVRLHSFVQPFKDAESPIVFLIGAVAHADPIAGSTLIEETIKIADEELTAACCCAKICAEFEELWDVY